MKFGVIVFDHSNQSNGFATDSGSSILSHFLHWKAGWSSEMQEKADSYPVTGKG